MRSALPVAGEGFPLPHRGEFARGRAGGQWGLAPGGMGALDRSLLYDHRMRMQRPLVFIVLVGGLFLAGTVLRREYGIEFSREGIEAFVSGLGWKAPAVFVALVTFRQFVVLPSSVVLSLGGVVFGAAFGAGLGALGVILSAVFGYAVARAGGRDWVEARLGARTDDFRRRAETAGPLLVGAVTAHPAGPMTPIHWGAGLASVPALGFVVAVLVGAPIRAALYASFGATLLEPGTPRFYLATLVLLAVTIAPFLHAKTRKRLIEALRPIPTQSA